MSDVIEDKVGKVINEPLTEALSRRYLAYALSTITSRALPDVRDGLKPVQRRILFGMRELKLNPDTAYRKCAKLVGEVMGNYHPHGDAAIYNTLVRLAQEFSLRYPLVDGQGNFGNIDGDTAAAMRYTESRMTFAAKLLLEGLDENTVDFRDAYDELNSEPVVLPAEYPNLLANGATGIAVGMATSIPPHNVTEVIDAALLLINKKKTTTADILEIIQGPDFPTGGIIVDDRESIRTAYETGRGSFRLRAKWHKEDLGRGTYQIVVTEVPYHVQKSKLVERLAEMIETKKNQLLGDVNDESAEDIRIVLTPRAKTVKPEVLMESLFGQSDLETRFGLNMNVLHKGVPRVMSLRDVLKAYLDHRREVVVRRKEYRKEQIEKRLHLLDGYLVAYLNIDEVIAIIRTEDDPKYVLAKKFKLSETQAEAILNLRLRALRRLEEIEIKREHENLKKERAEIDSLLKSEGRQWSEVSKLLRAARKRFEADTKLHERRTIFAEAPDINLASEIEESQPKEALTVILSKKGWIRSMRGHGIDLTNTKFKEGDSFFLSTEIMSNERIVLISEDGRSFMLPADKLPSGRGHGEPIRLSIDLEDTVGIVEMFRFDGSRKRIIASLKGIGFVVPEKSFDTQRRAGRKVMNLANSDRVARCCELKGDMVAIVGTNRKMLILRIDDLPEQAHGRGVKLQKYKDREVLADVTTFSSDIGLVAHYNDRERTFTEWENWVGKRSNAGRIVPKGFPKSGKFSG